MFVNVLLWVFVTINVQELMETGEGIRFLGIRQFLATMSVLDAEFSSRAASTINPPSHVSRSWKLFLKKRNLLIFMNNYGMSCNLAQGNKGSIFVLGVLSCWVWITLIIFNLCVSCWSCYKVTWRAQIMLYLTLGYRFTWPEMPNCLLESINYLSIFLVENRTTQKPITPSKFASVIFSIFNFKLWSSAHGFRIII